MTQLILYHRNVVSQFKLVLCLMGHMTHILNVTPALADEPNSNSEMILYVVLESTMKTKLHQNNKETKVKKKAAVIKH